ncbi:hypothetical protein M2323_002142 [Rhodoblastus acidophilus]|uniref:outer membrane beta-barrel protein n=1 Tax=Rhodoblastus acidophilus TaxID=1074 RepID=UPI0022247197|nr:outer membrane beta-barrel protein [Rhodoblastus acidophilus]MCW2284309.1 hypothetical protein [Rhodoblastus acidophilus]MCW2333213.1 hypothetical protein [Rhodoblastus acidophilus]
MGLTAQGLVGECWFDEPTARAEIEMISSANRLIIRAVPIVAAILLPVAAVADEAGLPPSGGSSSGSGAAMGPSPDRGIPFEGWMLYPSLFVGGVFNDNVYQTASNRTSAFGFRLTPNIQADLDVGIHKATAYAMADGQMYPGRNASLGLAASTLAARTGLAYIWSPTSDVVARFSVDYTRQDGPFGSTLATAGLINSATSFVNSSTSLNSSGFRQFSDVTTLALSVQKNVTEQTFVRIGGGMQNLVYERAPNGYSGGYSGDDYNASIRGGFWVTPQINAFVEAGGDLRRYFSAPLSDTNSYRVIGGLSSDMIGLFRGEVYGGVQEQFSAYNVFAAYLAPAFGGRVTYYPLEYLTIAASLDNSFGAAGVFNTVGSAVSSNNQTLQARLQADYKLYEYWTASARGGYARTTYPGSSSVSETWLAAGGVSYNFWRNFALTLDYQYTWVTSGVSSQLAYSDNLASFGVTYRY